MAHGGRHDAADRAPRRQAAGGAGPARNSVGGQLCRAAVRRAAADRGPRCVGPADRAGTTTLFNILHSRHSQDRIKSALKETVLIARGPKPVAALKALGLHPTLTVPEPNTWADVISTLDAHRPVKGLRVAVQEYGLPNRDLLEALTQRGAHVVPVPVYRWALPEDTAPLKQILGEIVAGQVHVMLVTNAAQIDHGMQVVEQEGQSAQFKQACKGLVIASIGPTASERLRHHGLSVDLEPSHGKMGILVKETSEQVHSILKQRNNPA
ncbi:MAG: uroporphyrinogen-III synthase [Nitrospira sp.]|nr:uroporphyrinogen-III synthase [Nitrospira sp.]